ncbi:MAG: hypothetical protein KME31_17235 [Tolypothrix carrinoi HA7290-LM1]|nr:hypothetical protein [Tolypothrix carrinoi HA7290-LM1]
MNNQALDYLELIQRILSAYVPRGHFDLYKLLRAQTLLAAFALSPCPNSNSNAIAEKYLMRMMDKINPAIDRCIAKSLLSSYDEIY